MRRLLVAVLGVALVALPLAGCGGGKGSDTYVLDVQGVADVVGPGPVQHLQTGRHRLRVGQTVTVTQGRAVLGLPGDTSLELRTGRRDSTVRVGPRPVLVDGDALAVAGSGDDLTVAVGGATFDLHDGAARVRRSAGVTVAVYQGEADVRSLGRRLEATALRQVSVTDSGTLPTKAAPLVYDRLDPDQWDVRYLNDAIDLGSQLERMRRVVNARPAPPTWDAGYLRGIVPALREAKGFSESLVTSSRSVGETVVGASIALGGTGDLVRRWDDAFAFRDEGADWGLVALDQRARRASVLGVLNGVLDRVVAPISPIVDGGGPVQRAGSGATSRPSTTTTTTPRRGTTTPTVPTAPATPLLPPITVPILPSSPTPTTPPTTTPTRPSSPPTIPSTPKPTIPPVTLPPPVQGLLDGLLGNRGNGNGQPGNGNGKGNNGNGNGNGGSGHSLLGDLLQAVAHGR